MHRACYKDSSWCIYLVWHWGLSAWVSLHIQVYGWNERDLSPLQKMGGSTVCIVQELMALRLCTCEHRRGVDDNMWGHWTNPPAGAMGTHVLKPKKKKNEPKESFNRAFYWGNPRKWVSGDTNLLRPRNSQELTRLPNITAGKRKWGVSPEWWTTGASMSYCKHHRNDPRQVYRTGTWPVCMRKHSVWPV